MVHPDSPPYAYTNLNHLEHNTTLTPLDLLMADQQSGPRSDLEDFPDTLARSGRTFHIVFRSDFGSDGLTLSTRKKVG
jgi:hypothetical protein